MQLLDLRRTALRGIVLAKTNGMERMEDLRHEREESGAKPFFDGGPAEIEERVFALGRSLLEHLETPVIPADSGLPSTILPAGSFGLLVLGIPVPVFSYMGDDNQALQRRVVGLLNAAAGATLDGSRHVGLHSFSRCFGRAPEEDVLALLPGFCALNGSRKASLLGVQMVTVLPLSPAEAALWPEGPSSVRRCVDRFRQVIPEIYGQLDRDMIRIHQSRPLTGRRRRMWAGEPSG